jgi:mono/diheme cytochrome c family protein
MTGVRLAPVVAALVASSSVVFAEEPARAVTFAKDVAPIFQDKCQSCHRPDSIAPMSLLTYEEARPWATAIKLRVQTRQMPPWDIVKTVGIQHFENDRSLSDEQIATIVRWVESGAPKGDPKDLPAPRTWPKEDVWNYAEQFGPPDLIIRSPVYSMPAQAQDAWYRPVVDTGVTEPRWVRAIEIKPATLKGRRITHHAVARLRQDDGFDEKRSIRGSDAAGTPGLFMEWAVGKQGEIARPDTGKLMLPGSRIVWDIHYHAVGEAISDSVEMAVYFYPKGQEPTHRQVLGQFDAITGGRQNLDIPPNSVSVHQAFHVMKQAGRIENFQPHMHLRGKAMSMEAILPDGTVQVLSHSNFQFNWHNNYVYTDDAAPLLPRGTVLRITAWHDNTAANKSNPDPNQWVGWGDRTVDEMAHAWVNVTYLTDAEYEAEVARRKTPPVTTSAAVQR